MSNRMKAENTIDAVHNNKVFSQEEQEIAEYLKQKNLDYTNRKWPLPIPKDTVYTRYVKRGLDLTLAVPAVVLLIPAYVLISVGVFLDVGRPIIYKQTRVGKNGKVFDLLKFRSMNEKKNEKGELLPPKERVTKFGRIIRKYSLDELLEFLNIVKGDMSIIGPRPLPVFFVERMSDRHKMRHSVRPGLECPRVIELAYPYDCMYQLTFENDIWYAEHVSFLQDIKMLLHLMKMVVSFDKRGAQAVADGISYFLGYDEEGLAISMLTYNERSKENAKI